MGVGEFANFETGSLYFCLPSAPPIVKRLPLTIYLMLPVWLLLGWLGVVTPSDSGANQPAVAHQSSLASHSVIRPYQKKGGIPALAEQERVRQDPMVLAPRVVVVLSDYLLATFAGPNELQRSSLYLALPMLDHTLLAVPTRTCHRLLRAVLQPNAP